MAVYEKCPQAHLYEIHADPVSCEFRYKCPYCPPRTVCHHEIYALCMACGKSICQKHLATENHLPVCIKCAYDRS